MGRRMLFPAPMKPLGNKRRSSGVYRPMIRSLICLLLIPAALAQFRQNDLLQSKLNAIDQAWANGRFTEAASLREDARRIFESLPPDAPAYAGSARTVARLYESGARTAQARTVLQSALDRASSLPAYDPARVELLTALSDSWLRDRNLRKALWYAQKAAAAQEATPPTPPTTPSADPSRTIIVSGKFSLVTGNPFYSARFYADSSLDRQYRRLASIEQQLGHPEGGSGVECQDPRGNRQSRRSRIGFVFGGAGRTRRGCCDP